MLSQRRPIITPSPEVTGQLPHDVTPPDRPGRAHILYAEDDVDSRLCWAEFLRRTGYVVTAVNDGRQAWETLQKAEYDLLITDNDMPHLNGVQLAANALHHNPGLPIIIISGNLKKISATDRESLGSAALLQKPVLMQNLLETVALVLSQKKLVD